MLSGMAQAAINPLDLIMGLGGKPPTTGQKGSGTFGDLLGLFPQMAPLGLTSSGQPASDQLAAVLTEFESLGNTELLISPELANLLGMASPIALDALPTMRSDAKAEPMIFTSAEIVAAPDGTDGSDGTVYLKIPVDPALVPSGLVDNEVADGQELILPMRLRTIEHSGDRIIADADLMSATGKDVSATVKLELAGNISSLDLAALTGEAPKATSPAVARAIPNILPRLISELGVKQIIVEQVETPEVQSVTTLLPGAVAQTSGQAAPATVDSLQKLNTVHQNNGLVSTGGGEVTPDNNAFLDGRQAVASENVASQTIDAMLTKDETSTASTRTLSDVLSSVGTTGAASQPSAPVDMSQSNSESVRFFNLDGKIDQLKQNPGQSIKVQLMPAQLGKMDLTIATHRGVVTVNLALESTQAKQVVERNLGNLESHLASSGIKVDNFHITVNTPRGDSMAQQNNLFHQQANYGQQGGGQRRRMPYDRQTQTFKNASTAFSQVMVNVLA